MEDGKPTDGRAMLEQAFARGSAHSGEVVAVAPERSEHSVMAGLPPEKAERIAAMRRELAELQRQLSEAQQRIATELQGRADDAERIEALETRLQAQESKAQEDSTRTADLTTEIASLKSQLATFASTTEELRRDVTARDALLESQRSSLDDAKALLETRTAELATRTGELATRTDELATRTNELTTRASELATRTAELATRTGERDAEQAAKTRLERELEDERKQHREATSQLESQVASLRDANALVATRDGELAALTAERDALKGEAAAARAKVRDVATQLARLGQELIEGGGPAGANEPSDASKTADRPKPPPPPPPRVTGPQQVETILEVTEEPRSKSRSGLLLIGGVLLGCVATMAFVKWGSADAAGDRDHSAPTAALVSERTAETASPPTAPDQAAAGTSAEQPSPLADTAGEQSDSQARVAAPAEPATDGVIVLPQEAADHRVFVDGRVVPVKNSRAVVPCGTREIRIGSRGAPRTIAVACGAETAVLTETSDR